MQLIDTHCHLDEPDFDADRADVLARARAAGVETIVIPSIRPASWERSLALAGDGIRVALRRPPADRVRPLRRRGAGAARSARAPAARGDRRRRVRPRRWLARSARQERIFRLQIALARELRLPLLVHILRAHDVAPRLLAEERAGEVGGILHSYSGGEELVPIYRDLGFHFSFAGPVTYARARRPVAAARAVPDELLLAETDAPDQTPEPYRGRRCEPAFVREVVAGLAAARGRPHRGDRRADHRQRAPAASARVTA
jgi:TatD DNase family protein